MEPTFVWMKRLMARLLGNPSWRLRGDRVVPIPLWTVTAADA
jgi:hypothetical protein